jgi:hypothetical protein
MEKTAQQLRFEASWLVKWPNDEPRIFEQDTKGTYTWPEVQDTFDGFALGEASALERAAKETLGNCGCMGSNATTTGGSGGGMLSPTDRAVPFC